MRRYGNLHTMMKAQNPKLSSVNIRVLFPICYRFTNTPKRMKQRAIDERMEEHGCAESAASDQGEATPGPRRGRRNDGVVHASKENSMERHRPLAPFVRRKLWRHNHGQTVRCHDFCISHLICLHLWPLLR
jgi:hypothetical protein